MAHHEPFLVCAHCQNELTSHFMQEHKEWVQESDAWYSRISREWRAEQAERRAVLRGRTPRQYDHVFLTGCGIREG